MGAPKPVPVVAPDGTPGTVPKAEVRAVVEAGGHVMAPTEAAATKKRVALESQFEGDLGSQAEGAIAPVLAGAARGLTLGGSDVALAGIGGEGVRRRLLDYQEYAPVSSAAGEAGAIAGAALFGDEAGVGALPRLVSRIGAGAEAGVARGLGGGLLARGAGRLAAGAAEGAIYSTGKAASEAALHDEDLTAEKALAAAGHGALFGAGANALFAGAGAGLGRLLGRETGAVETAATRAEGGLARAEGGVARSESTGLGDMLQQGADVKTIKALGGSAGDIGALERNVQGGYRRVAQDLRGDIEATTGKSIGFHNRESLNDYATARVEDLGDKLGGMLRKLDESGSGIAPDVKSFAAKVRQELIAPNTVTLPTGETVIKPFRSDAVSAIEKGLGEVEGAFGHKAPTFTEWQQARRGLDDTINFARVNKSPAQKSLEQLRGMMEKELETSGEAAAQNVGGSFAEQYQATKSLYQSVKKAEELTARGVSKELGGNSVGMNAMLAGGAGLIAGGPLAGIAMGVAGKLIKDRGDMFAADLLHRAANIAGVQGLAARTSEQMSRGIAGLLGTKAIASGAEGLAAPLRRVAAPLGVALSGDIHKDFDKVSAATSTLAANPEHLATRVAAALGPSATKTPGVAAAATQLMLGDVAYLNSKLPQRRTDALTLQPQLQPATRASDAEKSDFLRTARALDNPMVMLKDAKEGNLNPQTVEAIKERRPKLYEQMRQEIAQSLVTSTSELPYGRRLQLGILLDLPTDQTLAPDFRQAIQATYSSAEKAGAESPPPTLSRPLAIANGQSTSLEAAMSEGLEK